MAAGGIAAAAIGLALGRSHAATQGRAVPPFSQSSAPPAAALDSLVLAGGCFWGMQGVFQHVKGVRSVYSGYAGGDRGTAIYDVVGTGRTAHAESIRITFDPQEISLAQLLQIFFSAAHDPTQVNRQGPDQGPQYRSAIFPRSEEQTHVAQAYIYELNNARVFEQPIATRVEIGKDFFQAEPYHQDFMNRYPKNPYIVTHERPKLDALARLFPALYRSEPLLVGVAQ